MIVDLTLQRRPDSDGSELPVAIIGAGPVGLAAAAQLRERDIRVVVLEAGPDAGSSIREWGHVRFFSPWEMLTDAAAMRLLGEHAWPAAPPTGAEFVETYLAPLAEALGGDIRYDARVVTVSRQGMDKTRTQGRNDRPFELRLDNGEPVLARAVIDASGTWAHPNSVLSSGATVTGSISPLSSALPDVIGADRERFEGRNVAVVGAGHSAVTTLLALAETTATVTWIVRNASPHRVLGSVDDELSDRGLLGERIAALVETGRVQLLAGFEIDDVVARPDKVRLAGRCAGQAAAVDVDVVVAATGFRPDLEMLRELRLRFDDVVEAPAALAPLIDPNLHSCGTVEPHGVTELTHPEPNFYIAGMKSYGRAPTFLLATGYEQVRSIADELAGNPVAARRVQLVLPATGVCSTDVAGGCCS